MDEDSKTSPEIVPITSRAIVGEDKTFETFGQIVSSTLKEMDSDTMKGKDPNHPTVRIHESLEDIQSLHEGLTHLSRKRPLSNEQNRILHERGTELVNLFAEESSALANEAHERGEIAATNKLNREVGYLRKGVIPLIEELQGLVAYERSAADSSEEKPSTLPFKRKPPMPGR